MEQVPLPQLADSIWAAIEQQLDAGTADSGDNSPSGNPPDKGLPGASRLFYVLVPAAIIIATTWYFGGNKKTPADNKEQATPVIPAGKNTLQQDSTRQINAPAEKTKIPVMAIPDSAHTNPTTITFPGSLTDSALSSIVQIPPADTISIKKNNLLLSNRDTANVSSPPGKPKGIKGITAGDYKIVPDTTKKKN